MQSGYFEQIEVNIQDNYTVIVGKSLVNNLNDFIDLTHRVVITDSNVYGLYGKLMEKFSDAPDDIFYFKAGEKSKNYKTLHEIYDFLLKKKADRYTYILAFGGGVTGDVAGFAASTYMRGIPIVHIPTSLLAMVDSSIGGKTAINYGGFKNIVGSFYQPKCVLCDIDFLHTLNEREFNSSLAEIIKYGIIRDRDLFEFIEKNREKIKNRDEDALFEVVKKSVKNKVEIVETDEKEKGQRALLNFGHTLAHAIESLTEYKKYLHGEAVSVGEVFAGVLSLKEGLAKKEDVLRIKNLLEYFNLPTSVEPEFEGAKLYEIMEKDKKNKDGVLRFVLTKGIGSSIIADDLNRSGILDAIDELKG